MKSQIVLSVVLCLLFSFTQAFDLKSHNTRAAKTCNVKVIIEDLENFVGGFWDVFDEVYISYKDLVVDAAECVNKRTDVVSCFSSALTTLVNTLTPELEQYVDNLINEGHKFIDDVSGCA